MSFIFQNRPVLSWLTATTTQTNFRAMALFRIVFSLILLLDYFLNISPNYDVFYTDKGLVPLALWHLAYYNKSGAFSLLAYSNLTIYHALIRFIYVAGLLAFLTGYRTRLANFIVFIIFVSFYWRNELLVCNIDVLMRALLLFSLFLPLNRFWAFDAALEMQDRMRPFPIVPLVAIKLQISIIYLFSGLSKLTGYDGHTTDWVTGMAVGKALLDNFNTSPFGRALAMTYPDLTVLSSYIIPYFQICFVMMVYSPVFNNMTRILGLIGAILMHVGFMIFMNVGFFPYLCLAYLLFFVPDEWIIRARERHRLKLSGIKIFYDPDCGFCKKTALLLREFCLNEQVAVLPSSADPRANDILRQYNTWVVYGADGTVYTKWRAVSYVMKQSFLFMPVGALTDIPPLQKFMERVYNAIGGNRPALGRLTGRFMPWRHEKQQPAWATALCLVVIFLTVLYSALLLPQMTKGTPPPLWLQNAARIFQVEQGWALFAPDPISQQKKSVITAVYADGSRVDINKLMSTPLSFEGDVVTYRLNRRWRQFFLLLPQQSAQVKTAFTDYLCRSVNKHATDPAKKAIGISVYYSFTPGVFPPNEHIKPDPTVLLDGMNACLE